MVNCACHRQVFPEREATGVVGTMGAGVIVPCYSLGDKTNGENEVRPHVFRPVLLGK